MNFVMNHRGEFIELQAPGEGRAFTNRELHCLLDAGRAGVRRLMKAQREALRGIGGHLLPLPMVVVASGNAHKLQELTALFRGVCQPVSMKEVGFEGDIDENGSTFEENARIKAECVMEGHRPSHAGGRQRPFRGCAGRRAGHLQRPLCRGARQRPGQ